MPIDQHPENSGVNGSIRLQSAPRRVLYGPRIQLYFGSYTHLPRFDKALGH